jgi:hypothetical protein
MIAGIRWVRGAVSSGLYDEVEAEKKLQRGLTWDDLLAETLRVWVEQRREARRTSQAPASAATPKTAKKRATALTIETAGTARLLVGPPAPPPPTNMTPQIAAPSPAPTPAAAPEPPLAEPADQHPADYYDLAARERANAEAVRNGIVGEEALFDD